MVKKLISFLLTTLICIDVIAGDSFTRYDFSFETDPVGTVVVQGYFLIPDGAFIDPANGYETTQFGGTLVKGGYSGSPGLTSGSMSSLTVYDTTKLSFSFVVNGLTYYTDFGGGPTKVSGKYFGGYTLGWTEGATALTLGILSPYSTPTRPEPLVQVVENVQVPEINGDKLPQVLMLIAGLFMAHRSRKLLKLPQNAAVQAA